jgi:S-adenosyl methyltransferase
LCTRNGASCASREQIARFFDGLDLVEPGIVHLPDRHPDEPVSRPLDMSGLLYLGGLARKPQNGASSQPGPAARRSPRPQHFARQESAQVIL